MKKSIFFDVDNTLVCREKNVVCESTLTAIEALKEKKVKVAIATGRSLAMVKQDAFHHYLKQLFQQMDH